MKPIGQWIQDKKISSNWESPIWFKVFAVNQADIPEIKGGYKGLLSAPHAINC